ncbi:MAG TPA: hypothetical protein VJ869_17715, partial [Sphaerochaeta sp.]|nr:hypothetical protein [Sphaerochaeta sp.]
MKKTIAILLVLVLAGVGLFAVEGNGTSATLTLKTVVGNYNLMAITPTEFTGTTILAWDSHNAPANLISNPVTLSSGVVQSY